MAEIEWLARRLRNAGLDVRTVDGWKDRGRPPSTGTFNPRGVLLHHTAAGLATTSNPHPARWTVINGRSDLPGPLCHVLVDFNGVCHVIAAGRANHAGWARASGPLPEGDGNSLYVGIEIDYDPRVQAASPAQKQASLKAAAAIVTRLGHGRRYVRAHKETSVTGKIDPDRYMPMSEARERIGNIIQRNGW
ncbi:peptidoglycan recognition protein family protein [Thalassiella azotivora]